MTREQIILFQTSLKKVGIDSKRDRARYELLLHNVAGVSSCKDLNHRALEDCMAVLEDMGLPGRYWRDKVTARGSHGTARMVWKIRELFDQYESSRGEGDTHYELAGLIARASKQRTADPAQLSPREAWSMIEQLKKMIARLQAEAVTPPAEYAGECPF